MNEPILHEMWCDYCKANRPLMRIQGRVCYAPHWNKRRNDWCGNSWEPTYQPAKRKRK